MIARRERKVRHLRQRADGRCRRLHIHARALDLGGIPARERLHRRAELRGAPAQRIQRCVLLRGQLFSRGVGRIERRQRRVRRRDERGEIRQRRGRRRKIRIARQFGFDVFRFLDELPIREPIQVQLHFSHTFVGGWRHRRGVVKNSAIIRQAGSIVVRHRVPGFLVLSVRVVPGTRRVNHPTVIAELRQPDLSFDGSREDLTTAPVTPPFALGYPPSTLGYPAPALGGPKRAAGSPKLAAGLRCHRWDIPHDAENIPNALWDIPAVAGDIPNFLRQLPNVRGDIPKPFWDVPNGFWETKNPEKASKNPFSTPLVKKTGLG